ncbi:MAG: hypothetical protein KA184_11465 [Candidatus Hydrogenedentes bacterium]|nr:hypothetical protein [Candidatus Hydrogenedentota bacterium]
MSFLPVDAGEPDTEAPAQLPAGPRVAKLANLSASFAVLSGVLFAMAVLLAWLPGSGWYSWSPPFIWGFLPWSYLCLYCVAAATLGCALAAIVCGEAVFIANACRGPCAPCWRVFFVVSLGVLFSAPIAVVASLLRHELAVATLGGALLLLLSGHVVFLRRNARAPLWRAFFGSALGSVAAILIALPLLGFSAKWRHNMDAVVCPGNLHLLEAKLRRYAEDNAGRFPPLSSQPGVLMFSREAIPPDSDILRALTCPTARYAGMNTAGYEAARARTPVMGSQSYFYLGYALLDDDDVEAFARAYRTTISRGGTFDDDLVVGDGLETRVLHRLQIDVMSLWRQTGDPNALSPYEGRERYGDIPDFGGITSDVPVLIERGVGHIFTDWDSRPRFSHVVYLNDGLRSVERGTWPITEQTLTILEELAD